MITYTLELIKTNNEITYHDGFTTLGDVTDYLELLDPVGYKAWFIHIKREEI